MKKPTDATLVKFRQRWNKAHGARNRKNMEALLTKKWLNYWWWIFQEAADQRQRTDYLGCIEYLLIKEGLVGDRPERPSERAMRLAEKEFSQSIH